MLAGVPWEEGPPGGSLRIHRRDLPQDRPDGRTIRRPIPDMMQGNDPGRIDEHIPAALEDVPFRLPQLPAPEDFLQVRPPAFRPPDIPEGSGEHPVVPVGIPGGRT